MCSRPLQAVCHRDYEGFNLCAKQYVRIEQKSVSRQKKPAVGLDHAMCKCRSRVFPMVPFHTQQTSRFVPTRHRAHQLASSPPLPATLMNSNLSFQHRPPQQSLNMRMRLSIKLAINNTLSAYARHVIRKWCAVHPEIREPRISSTAW